MSLHCQRHTTKTLPLRPENPNIRCWLAAWKFHQPWGFHRVEMHGILRISAENVLNWCAVLVECKLLSCSHVALSRTTLSTLHMHSASMQTAQSFVCAVNFCGFRICTNTRWLGCIRANRFDYLHLHFLFCFVFLIHPVEDIDCAHQCTATEWVSNIVAFDLQEGVKCKPHYQHNFRIGDRHSISATA